MLNYIIHIIQNETLFHRQLVVNELCSLSTEKKKIKNNKRTKHYLSINDMLIIKHKEAT